MACMVKKMRLKYIACSIYDITNAYIFWFRCKHIVKETICLYCDLIKGLFDIIEDIFGDDVPDSVEDSPHKPFIADIDKLTKNSRIRHIWIFKSRKYNYLKGVFNISNGQIINPTYVAGDYIDNETKDVMGDEAIVVIG